MRFSEILTEYVNGSSRTKNTIIREAEVDRSTFYQILKGKRLPTRYQFARIAALLDLDRDQFDRLHHAFEAERHESTEKYLAPVQSFLNRVNEGPERILKEDYTAFVSAELLEMIRNEFERGGRIDFFLPQHLMYRWHFLDILFQESEKQAERKNRSQQGSEEGLLDSRRAAEESPMGVGEPESMESPESAGGRVSVCQIRQIWTSGYEWEDERWNLSLAETSGLFLFVSRGCSYSVWEYPIHHDRSSLELQPSPYYVIGADWIFLSSIDGTQTTMLNNREYALVYQNNFEKILPRARRVFYQGWRGQADYNTPLEKYGIPDGAWTGQRCILASEKFCALPLLSDELLVRLAELQPDLREKIHRFMVGNAMRSWVEFSTEQGVEETRRSGQVLRYSTPIVFDGADRERLNAEIRSCLGKRLFLPKLAQCVLHGWTIQVREKQDVIIFQNACPETMLRIVNPNIVDEFFQYYHGLVELFKAREDGPVRTSFDFGTVAPVAPDRED